jgi:hypothetical protein
MSQSIQEEKALDDLITKQARNLLVRAKFAHRKDLPTKTLNSGQTKSIPKHVVIGGAVIFTKVIGLGSGSAGTFNLYELLLAYLHDDQARTEMNRVATEAKGRMDRAMSAESERARLAQALVTSASQA